MNCEDCKNCLIVEDRDYDYPPFASCNKGHTIVDIDIMEWEPKNKPCKDYEEGEPEVL